MSAEQTTSSPPPSDKIEAAEKAPDSAPNAETTAAESKSDGDQAADDATAAQTESKDDDKAGTPTEAKPLANEEASKDESPAAGGSSAKRANNSKRRSSAGVPEHKNKKLNKKKSKILQLSAEPGDVYWAHTKGSPAWPCVICDEEMLPETLLASRPVTAKRPDGTYREDVEDDGKNVRERTYAVMFLGTYEFAWTKNFELKPLEQDELAEKANPKGPKSLIDAYESARENHDLAYFKKFLADHQKNLEEEAELIAQAEAKKASKKDKKPKRKSKDAAVEDEDEEMEDAPASEEAKPSKKRKKGEDNEDDEKPQKTPKSLKLTTKKTPNGTASASASKAKAKTPKATTKTATPKPAPKSGAKAQPTEEQLREKRQKEILYLRHRLQKGFLTTETPPKDEEMGQMAKLFTDLEKQQNLEPSIIKATKIHKVLRGIVKLSSIPREEEFNFRQRSIDMLEEWAKLLDDESIAVRDHPKIAETSGKDEKTAEKEKEAENEEPAEEKKADDAEDEAEKKDAAEAEAEAEPEKPNDVGEKDKDGDAVMSDAGEDEEKVEKKDDGEAPGEDREQADKAADGDDAAAEKKTEAKGADEETAGGKKEDSAAAEKPAAESVEAAA
ncbi:MAG: hypothetical protein M1831_000356 [Alyxoria varia]|nr:MAG: hypothetical protein M1831_000356 [Alyxoria varia]